MAFPGGGGRSRGESPRQALLGCIVWVFFPLALIPLCPRQSKRHVLTEAGPASFLIFIILFLFIFY